jgi:hypothetical protein
MNDLKLYQLSEDFKQLMDVLSQEGGELTESYEYYLAQLEDAIRNKSDNCASYYQSQVDLMEVIKKRRDELDSAYKSIKNKIERFEQYLLECMCKMEVKELIGETTHIKIRKPSKKVEITSLSSLPKEYVKQEVVFTPDKAKLLKVLKSGEKIDGAKIVDGKQGLSIKVRS